MTPGRDSDSNLELQRALVEAGFREGWVPVDAGDSPSPLSRRPFIDHVTDAEVIVHGDSPGRRVAVLFSHHYFPGVRFGHRFRLEPSGENRELIWLKEEIETGALKRMMQNEPVADDTGVIWTTWGC